MRPIHTTPTAFILAGAVAALAAGCAENTIIRRTAIVPSPNAPSRSGMPLEKGEFRIEGTADALALDPVSPVWLHDGTTAGSAGDPGVLVPEVQLGAQVWAGLPKGFEIGAHFRAASYEWMRPNVNGVLAFPRGTEEDLFQGGIGLRYNVSLGDDRFALAFITEFSMVQVPEAIFVCRDATLCSGDQGLSASEAAEAYDFDRVDHELFFLPTVGAQFGYRALPELFPYVMLGGSTGVTNTGFDDNLGSLPDDTLESYWMGYFGVGVEAKIDRFVAGVAFYYPFGGEPLIDFGPMLSVKLGVSLK